MADNGAYDALSEQNTSVSLLRNYLTTASATQGGQGSTVAASHIPGWDRPLLPQDDRPPATTGKPPFWDKDPIEMGNVNIDLTGADGTGAASSSTAPKQKPMQKRPPPKARPDSKARPGFSGTPPSSPKAKPRPTPPGTAPPWVIATLLMALWKFSQCTRTTQSWLIPFAGTL